MADEDVCDRGRVRVADARRRVDVLTTPIYYVNATPHIGHAYTTSAATSWFAISGSAATRRSSYRSRRARDEGLPRRRRSRASTPQEYADRIAEDWRELPQRLNADPTSSSARAMRATSASSGTSSSGSTTTATSTRTSTRASTASAVRSSRPRGARRRQCPIHDIAPEWIEEKNYFFRLSAYQDRLLALYDERPDFVLPGFRFNEARSFIAGGLQDFSSAAPGSRGGSRCRGTRARSPTSGSTRSSTT